jgi:hypothetical protein
MNKQEALNKLAALEAETKALRAIIEAPEVPALPVRWRPSGGERYYIVKHSGIIQSYVHAPLTGTEYEYGNGFKTAAHAEIASKAVSVTLKLCAAAFAVDPDAGVQIYNERSWSAVKQRSDHSGKHEWIAGQYDITTSHPCYVHTHEQAKAMAAMLNAEGV